MVASLENHVYMNRYVHKVGEGNVNYFGDSKNEEA